MKKEIAFIMPYFGPFKPCFSLWLESVRRNPQITWIIITDNKEPQTIPKNVIWKESDLQTIQILAEEKLRCEVKLTRPYKLCDLKPLYGAIFCDYIKDYKYWGYGDLDVVYGRLYEYLKNIDYQAFDKINRWGHCTLLKNTKEINLLPFSNDGLKAFDIYKMLRDGEKNYGYDEIQHNEVIWKHGLKIFVDNFQADIDIFYERMRCVDKRTMVHFCKATNVTFAPTNYEHQVFLSDRGAIFRYYLKGKKVHKEEFAYIHYRQEAPIMMNDITCDTFVISRKGFFECDSSRLDDYDYVNYLIKQYNSQTLMITEHMTGTRIGKCLTDIYKDNDLLKKIWRKVKG